MEGVARDGSPVAVYLALPVGEEPDLVARVTPALGSVLELGCGAGRVTHALVERGFEVVAVDDSAAMLAEVRGAETVLADLYSLDLGRRFDTVVAASHLVDQPERSRRSSLLGVCRRHVVDHGSILVERYEPAWASDPPPGRARLGEVELIFEPLEVGDGWFRGRTTYEIGEQRWVQEYSGAAITDDLLERDARAAGLAIVEWLDDDRTWVRLRPT